MKPSVAVLICNWNRAELLDRSLWLLTEQTYPCEIWVVDTGSTDISENVAARYGVEWHKIREPESPRLGPYDGWKYAYEQVDADFIILSHPEVMVPLNAIELMLEEHGKTRSSASPFCLSPTSQRLIDTADWKKDVNEICALPDFWPYRNFWGYTNWEAMKHYELFVFTGQYRDQWDYFDFLPGDPDSDYFCGYEDWMVPKEMEAGLKAIKMPYSVYHQYHVWDKSFGRAGTEDEHMAKPRSVRIKRIREAQKES